jgi:hypothetical protein
VDPVPDPLLLGESGSSGMRARDLWICSQELRSLDHRGGHLLVYINIIFPSYLINEMIALNSEKKNGII